MFDTLFAHGKEALGLFAIALTIYAFFPYIRSIQKGETKPHVFSWILWGATTFIVFLAQYSDEGGAGAWPIGVSGLITLYVAGLAYVKKSDVTISKSDWVFFSIGVWSLPLWYITSDPLWAVVVLTFIDLVGFIPTFKKSYIRPHDEQLGFYVLMTARNFISILALQNYSLTTVLFPAAVGLAALLFVIMVIMRRAKLGSD